MLHLEKQDFLMSVQLSEEPSPKSHLNLVMNFPAVSVVFVKKAEAWVVLQGITNESIKEGLGVIPGGSILTGISLENKLLHPFVSVTRNVILYELL